MDKNEILNSDYDVRVSVAENPSTPVDVLAELAKDRDWYIRSYAAGNPNMLVDVLTELSKDSDYIVRCFVAGNPNSRRCVERISKR